MVPETCEMATAGLTVLDDFMGLHCSRRAARRLGAKGFNQSRVSRVFGQPSG
jgi:hypothetical protein